MALIKYGGGIVQMSGSIAGNTHARNRFGNYMRARTKPVNPQSSRQMTIRNIIAYLAEEWKDTLTAAQRQSWETYADNVSWLNRLGETVHLSGFNHFVRSNAAILIVGGTQVAGAPTTMSLPPTDPTISVALSEASGITVTFDDTFEWCDEDAGYLEVHIGNPQQITRNFFGGPWRFHDSIDGNSVTPPTSPDGPTAVTCWTLIEGHKVWTKFRIIREDGRVSTEFQAAPVAVAA